MKSKQSNVTFNRYTYIRHIPLTKEYINSGLKPELWWSKNDYIRFRYDAIQEVLEQKKR